MGGDRAPAAVVEGAVRAVRRGGITVLLVGAPDRIAAELAQCDATDEPGLTVVEAPDVIAMDESPVAALRRKPLASVRVATDLVARGTADAVFSAGHTGATLMSAHAAFGLLDTVGRPALAVTVPAHTGAAVLLDAGASVDCRPEHLVQFARMGAAYAHIALFIDQPRVGLLSIGEEAGKGNDLIREAHARLKTAPVNFIGNLEARDLFTGRADVIVCDGFTGNIALKVGEGLVEAIEQMLRAELDAALVSQIGALLMRRAYARFRQRVDYAEYGAAPLLGVAGLSLVGHGRSSPQAVESGIRTAARLVEAQMLPALAQAISEAAGA